MSSRDDRVPSIIAQLAAAFLLERANPDPLITVTRARVSPDRRRATIYVSVFPDSREADALTFLARTGGEFRTYTKQHAALTRIPHFDFSLDPAERERRALDALKLDASPEQES